MKKTLLAMALLSSIAAAHAADPLQDIQNRVADYAVVDANEYAYAQHLYPDVVPAFPLPESRPVQWVVRHTDPDLYKAVNHFMDAANQSGLLARLLTPAASRM